MKPTLEELVELSKRATPGPWSAVLYDGVAACNAAPELARRLQDATKALVECAATLESLWAAEHDGTALCPSMKEAIRQSLELARPVIVSEAREVRQLLEGTCKG